MNLFCIVLEHKKNKTKRDDCGLLEGPGVRKNTVSIQAEEVEVVGEDRFQEVYLNSRLNRKPNTEAVFKKGQNRPYFLRKQHLR